jgi:hypothetical protein
MPRKSAVAANLAIIPGTPQRLHPPKELSADERKIFADLVAASKPDHFRASDLPLLNAYCRTIAMERGAAQAIRTGKDKSAMGRWRESIKAMVMLSMRLRLSPQARAPNNSSRPQAVQRTPSYYDRAHLDGDADA